MPIDVTEILQFAGIGFLLGIIGMVFKKLDIAKDVSELITLAGYVYMLIFIVQLIEILMTSLSVPFFIKSKNSFITRYAPSALMLIVAKMSS